MKKKASKKQVLVPVDFSANSESALEFAAGIAECLEATLVVLHVVHDPSDAPGYYRDEQMSETTDGYLLRIGEAAERMLAKFLDRFRRRHPG